MKRIYETRYCGNEWIDICNQSIHKICPHLSYGDRFRDNRNSDCGEGNIVGVTPECLWVILDRDNGKPSSYRIYTNKFQFLEKIE